MKKKDDGEVIRAKRGYRNASEEGNRQEEARWANVIGDILKNRGEYVEALKWFRIDYDVSIRHLPDKHLLPTCQSLGEVYLRLQQFQDALIYQKKHLELAKDANDLIEQQRASTQLGRTYHEMYLTSDKEDQTSLQNAKKYFYYAMDLAHTLKKSSNKHTYIKEYIDSLNNIGMVEMDLDNFEQAENILTKGLKICDEEEVVQNDDGRTRLHNNLGNLYTELRKWDKAKYHIEKDIVICKNISHCQGEAKGYINLGELHYRVQKYEDAILCYEKAINLAKRMDDEHALVTQIHQNIHVVKEATKVMEDLRKEEQNLKKLSREMATAKGTSGERKCLLQQDASLDLIIEKSRIIFAWKKHCELAKKKKKIASQLCDKEKLGDSYLVIGESYQKLRNFDKAKKWITKSWETYKSIGNMEGQALAKINLGDVLDSVGKTDDALEAFSEGYRIACEGNVVSAQLSALENMHYIYTIRLNDVEEARRLQLQVDEVRQSNAELEQLNASRDCCSETDTEGDDISLKESDTNYSPKINVSKSYGSTNTEADDDIPLISLRHSNHPSSKSIGSREINHCASRNSLAASPRSISSKSGSRKRGRLVLSDDDDDEYANKGEHVATSEEFKSRHNISKHADEYKDVSPVVSKFAIPAGTPLHLEESSSSHKGRSAKPAVDNFRGYDDAGVSENICLRNGRSGPMFDACDDEFCKHIIFKVEDDFVHIEPRSSNFGDKLSMAQLKIEVACLYFLKLDKENRFSGYLPVIHHLKCGGEVLESLDLLDTPKDYICGKCWVEASINSWVPKRLIKLYVDCCKDLSLPPNLKLLTKLYNLVSEDDIDVSNCELEDISVTPLLNALQLHKTIGALNLSHNLLGFQTMEKINHVFLSSTQEFGGLVLDLHCNLFGQTALFQICQSTVLLSRLEVLNISGNRLTDGCGSCLSTILQNCKALYSLNIERCSITSRTVQRIIDSLDSGSLLSELFIGYNSSISDEAIVNLLDKLTFLKRFSQLNLNGLNLDKNAVDSLCKLVRTSCMSHVMIGDTSIGDEWAIQLTGSRNSRNRTLIKIDLSSCLLTSSYITKLNTDTSLISGILELNLGGNPLMQEGGLAMASILKDANCRLKIVDLSKCQIGLVGVLGIIQSLADNRCVDEINLSENALQADHNSLFNKDDDDGCVSELEVPDSDDEAYGDFTVLKSRFINEVSSAISMAKRLRLLDISNNGFSNQVGESLYKAWSNSRGGLTQRHIEGSTIHLSVEPIQCCNIKPCCKRF